MLAKSEGKPSTLDEKQDEHFPTKTDESQHCVDQITPSGNHEVATTVSGNATDAKQCDAGGGGLVLDAEAPPNERDSIWAQMARCCKLREVRSHPVLNKYMREKGEQYKAYELGGKELYRYKVAWVVSHDLFRLCIFSLVVVQVIIAGLDADHPDHNHLESIRIGIAVAMVLEVLISVSAFGPVYFEDDFNMIDVVVVALSFITACIWSVDADINHDHFHRFARAMNVMPMLRLASFIEPFADLSKSMAHAAYGVSFLMVMCFVILYGFSVACTQIIGNDPLYLDKDSTQADYGSVIDSMHTLVTVNLKITKNSQKLEDIDFMWMFFLVFHMVMIVGIFNMSIGLVKAGLTSSHANATKTVAENSGFIRDSLKKEIDLLLQKKSMRLESDARKYEEAKINTDNSLEAIKRAKKKPLPRDAKGVLLEPEAPPAMPEGYRVKIEQLRKFVKRAAFPEESRLTDALQKCESSGEQLLEAVDHLDRIEKDMEGVSAKRFLKEMFNTPKQARRFDILEIVCELKEMSTSLIKGHGDNTQRRFERHELLTNALAKRSESQQRRIGLMQEQYKSRAEMGQELWSAILMVRKEENRMTEEMKTQGLQMVPSLVEAIFASNLSA